jgi:2,3-bisphosphoglycerate-independent phosphoglycerate mutase
MTAPTATRPLVLVVLDGFGERDEREGNAIRQAQTPNLDALAAYPRTRLGASGPDVGLRAGRPGDGEIGHLHLGAGRSVKTTSARIDATIASKKLFENVVIADVIRIAKHHFEARLHLFALLSETSGHASLNQLLAIIDEAHFSEVPVVVHAILDGRDAPPRSAGALVTKLEQALDGGKKGEIGTLSGRAFAMDREGRWDRTNLAFTAIVRGKAPREDTTALALQKAYELGRSDDLIEPIRIGAYSGMKGSFMCDFASADRTWRWFGEENGFAVNTRPDGLRQLFAMFLRKNVPPKVEEDMLTDRGKPVFAFNKQVLATLTEYDPALGLPVAFPPEPVPSSFGEVIAAAGLKQLRCAAAGRRAHVTSFFNGGREAPFAGEDRVIVPSTEPADVARAVVEAIQKGEHDFILVNLGGPDAAGHASKLDAAIRAVEAADAAVGTIAAAVREAGGALVVTSDHGNCEQTLDAKGKPSPAHTTNPVPFYCVDDRRREIALREGGRLADVAPTLLELLGLPQPAEMTGRSLLSR